MSTEQRKATAAIYVWCRRLDDLVDSPRAGMQAKEAMERDLEVWRARLKRLFNDRQATDSLDFVLLDTLEKYPTLSIEPFEDMIKGMAMDTNQLGQTRYQTFDELYVYCYRVASTVGLMMIPIFGFAPGFTLEEARAPAVSLGIALQLTNIIRDVGEDAERGRIYIPQEDMVRFGVTEDQIFKGRVDENYRALMKFQIERAREYYEHAEIGIVTLAPEARLAVQAAAKMYGGILDKVTENEYDNLSKRAFVSRRGKFKRLLQSMIDVLQMSFGQTVKNGQAI